MLFVSGDMSCHALFSCKVTKAAGLANGQEEVSSSLEVLICCCQAALSWDHRSPPSSALGTLTSWVTPAISVGTIWHLSACTGVLQSPDVDLT